MNLSMIGSSLDWSEVAWLCMLEKVDAKASTLSATDVRVVDPVFKDGKIFVAADELSLR